MALVLTMPKLSATMAEATVIKWYKAAGERVLAGETLLEVETDKATLTIEAPGDGILGTPAVAAGEVARVGAALVMILDASADQQTGTIPESGARPIGGGDAGGDIGRASGQSRAGPAAGSASGRVFASPRARRTARERGTDLGSVTGTGPSGRIVRADLDRSGSPAGGELRGAADEIRAGSARPGRDPLAKASRQMALMVAASHREIPAFTLSRWIDMERVLLDLTRFDRRRTETDYFLYAIATAMAEVPEFRSVWNSGRGAAEDLGSTNVGVVVSTDHGLMIPVLADVGGVGLEELATRRRAAVEAARAGRLNQTFASAASISLSSLAREAADEFEAIISPGQTAIVAVRLIAESVVSRRGEIVVRKGCRVCVAADHRVIDGRTGARFISAMVRVLEEGVAPG